MMLAVDVHLDTKNCNFQMEHYIFKRHNDGIYIINLGKTWEKLQLAARDIIVQSVRPYGQRAVLNTLVLMLLLEGTLPVPSPINHLQTSFNEPRLLILTDPRTNHQTITMSFTCFFAGCNKEEKTENVKVLAFVTTKASYGCEDIVYNPNENLQHWLTDAKARDQFVIRVGSDTEVLWNDARHLKPDPVKLID
ncbi:40S ribosomal protein Sa-2 [Glycine soja]